MVIKQIAYFGIGNWNLFGICYLFIGIFKFIIPYPHLSTPLRVK